MKINGSLLMTIVKRFWRENLLAGK